MSTPSKIYGNLKFGCCVLATQNAIMRLKNMPKICVAFEKSEPRYAYRFYAYE